MKERLCMLRDELLMTQPKICIERAQIVTRCYQEMEQYPAIMKRALALSSVLREMTIYIKEGELIVGNQASAPRAAPLFPEYAYEFILEELDNFEKRESDRFTISEENKAVLRKILPWWRGKTLHDRAFAIQSEEVLRDRKVGVLNWEGNVSSGEGHIIPDYDTVLQFGFAGLLQRVNGLLEALKLTEPSDLEKLTFYRACKAVLEGCIDYILRFEKLALDTAQACSDPDRKRELLTIANNCKALSVRAPQTLYEALQCVWFVHVILHIESNGHSISLGRFDQYLYPFYARDLAAGILTEEMAKEYIGCFYLKCFGNIKLRPWGNTRTQMGYPTYQNICLAGQTIDGKDATNPLSYLCLETLAETRLPEPNVYIRMHPRLPQDFLRKAIKVVKMGFGMPAFVNDEVVIPSLIRRGVAKEDAYNYSTLGCTEVQVPGKWCYRPNGKSKINLLKILQLVLDGGRDRNSGLKVIDGIKRLEDCKDIEEIMEGYRKVLHYYMKLHVIADNINEMAMNDLVPDAFCSLLVQDCLGRGKAIKEGGVVYDIISGTLVGIPNVANALYALKRVVFDQGLVTIPELRSALDSNFAGVEGERIRQLLLNAAEKFGNDDDEVDYYAKRISDYFADEIYNYKTMRYGKGPIGCCYTSSAVTITANISCGAAVGATPDGRKAGEPTADGISPSRGTSHAGPTAVLKSVSKLSTELFTGGLTLNMRFDPRSIDTEEGEQKFAAFLRTFCSLKCWHIQFNMVSSEVLRDAQVHPELYQDLIVRVAGYSALYTSLSPELQNDIINRTEFGL